jgi:hypothetical protein
LKLYFVCSQKATISELEKQLEEERRMRREERDKATEDLRSTLEKAHAEAKEESKRQAIIYQRQHEEQQEVITKLQVVLFLLRFRTRSLEIVKQKALRYTKISSLNNLFYCYFQECEKESRLLVETLRLKLVQLSILLHSSNFTTSNKCCVLCYPFLLFRMMQGRT